MDGRGAASSGSATEFEVREDLRPGDLGTIIQMHGTLYALVKRGTLPSVSVPGLRRILIDRGDLERAIQDWKGAR